MKEVDSPITLTQWLRGQYPDTSHKEIKQWLQWGQISVNGQTVTNGGLLLTVGDRVARQLSQVTKTRRTPLPFPIIYQDSALIVIDKPPNLLSIATAGERHRTAYRMLNDWLSEASQRAVFIVHRLDRDTSGLLVFARDEASKENLQTQFRNRQAIRRYTAVVEGKMPIGEGTLTHYLRENEQHHVFVSDREGEGKLAQMQYQVRRSGNKYSELEITLETGRHNQIRAQLAAIGHPIAGDRLARSNPLKRLVLHAHYLAILNPRTNQLQEFHSPIPPTFRKLN
jgi:23S rRNA pseudouridine1911/1915/1917 synthase